MRPLLAVLLLVVLGCERPGLKPVAGELVVMPQAVAFEPTFVGFPREAEVVLNNRARASRTLTISLSGPFSTPELELVAAGGSELAVKLRFDPVEAGEVTGTLTIGDANETLVVELTGAGLQPPVCAPTAVCETSVFDPQLGRCVASQAADGTSCSNACLTAGMCSSGRCIGTPIDCADADACTVDACDPAVGCLHPPAECAAPTNPCKAARCDPALGCVESDVRDGVACGPADCVTALACITGVCKPVAVPDGAACGTASPCQGAGTCQQSVCVRPPAGQLTEAWSYTFPGPIGSFLGVSDPSQNLYWAECVQTPMGPGQCSLVSYTAAGAQRFRTEVSPFTSAPLHHLLAGDALVYAWDNEVGALSTSGGAELWSRQLPLNVTGVEDVADAQVITALAATPTQLTLTLARTQAQAIRQSVLLQLDRATGGIVFARFFDGALTAPVLDELGAISFRVTPWYTPNPMTPPSFVVSLTPSGVERWRVVSPISTPWELAVPVAAFQGELLLDDGELRSMVDGSRLAAGPMGTLASSSPFGLTSHPVMGPTARVLLRLAQSDTRVNALSMQRGVGQPTWEVTVHEMHGGNWLSDLSATANGGFLVAAGDSRHPTYLKAFDGAGAERFSCELPSSAFQGMPSTLLDQRWVVFEPPYQLTPKLRVYEVPSELPAARGWTGARGSPSGGHRPLP